MPRLFWASPWPALGFCLPAMILSLVIVGVLAFANRLLGAQLGNPMLTGLVALAVLCPLTKLSAVLVLRRRS